jgi:hypothetical protein
LYKGIEILNKLHKAADGSGGAAAQDEYLLIKSQIELDEGVESLSIITMMKNPNMRRRLCSGFFLQWLAQSSGVLVVFNYQVCNAEYVVTWTVLSPKHV